MLYPESLYDAVTSNYGTLGSSISKYFTDGTICQGNESINDLRTDVVNYGNRGCIGSVCSDKLCFPLSRTANIGLVSDIVSNQVLISVLLEHDEVGKGFQRIPSAVKCSTTGKYYLVPDVHPVGLLYPNKLNLGVTLEGLVRPSAIPDRSITVTPGLEFIVNLVSTVCHTLLDATEHFGFNHGNLTHESIGFRDGVPVICDLKYSSMSIQVGKDIVRVSPKINPIKKFFMSNYIPHSNIGFYKILDDQNMNGIAHYKSIDYYTFILSCLSIDYIFNTVMSNYLLKAIIFDSIFNTSDISMVYGKLVDAVNSGKPLIHVAILSILKNCTLRCNAMELTLERIGKLKNIL